MTSGFNGWLCAIREQHYLHVWVLLRWYCRNIPAWAMCKRNLGLKKTLLMSREEQETMRCVSLLLDHQTHQFLLITIKKFSQWHIWSRRIQRNLFSGLFEFKTNSLSLVKDHHFLVQMSQIIPWFFPSFELTNAELNKFTNYFYYNQWAIITFTILVIAFTFRIATFLHHKIWIIP